MAQAKQSTVGKFNELCDNKTGIASGSCMTDNFDGVKGT